MDLRTFYGRATQGGDIYPLLKETRDQFLEKHPESLFLTGNQLSINHRLGMAKLANNFAKAATFVQTKQNKDLSTATHLLTDAGGMFLNFQAFVSTIQMLGTAEQVKYWEDLAFQFKILGAYAQTEITHGSDVQSLEARAVFDEVNDCFVLNSPSVGSSKYWPGLLGAQCTHCVFQAQTYVKGKHIGVQTFVLQLRDPSQNMACLDGVRAGDIGPKLGFIYVDNGWLLLKDYKVSRENMLMRYCSVEKDGSVKRASAVATKLGYGSMLNLRVNLISGFARGALTSVTLAYRNTLPANMSRGSWFKEEFSRNSTLLLTHLNLKQLHAEFKILAAQTENKQVLQKLSQLHVLSAGLKTLSSWTQLYTVMNIITQHHQTAVLNSSAQVVRLTEAIPATTYEGDNHVLLQQTAKYIMKIVNKLLENLPISVTSSNAAFGFLVDSHNRPVSAAEIKEITIENATIALEQASYLLLKSLVQGKKTQARLIDASKFFVELANIRLAREQLEREKLSSEAKKALGLLLCINVLAVFKANKTLLFVFGLCKNDTFEAILRLKQGLLDQIDSDYLSQSFENVVYDSQQKKNNNNFDQFEEEGNQLQLSIKESLQEFATIQRSSTLQKL